MLYMFFVSCSKLIIIQLSDVKVTPYHYINKFLLTKCCILFMKIVVNSCYKQLFFSCE